MNKGIQKIFSEVPRTYELVNHILTFGIDTLLRKKSAKIASEGGGTFWLDVCTGTGEMAFYLRHLDKIPKIFALDYSLPMMEKALEKSNDNTIYFMHADVSSLPFQNDSFDLVVISFATRNISFSRDHLLCCIREFHRILKPGGRFINLETSQPSSKLLCKLFHLYVRLVVKHIGSLISQSKTGYAYLSHTIPRFYNADEFAKIIREAGFEQVTYHCKMFGIAAIHKAVKTCLTTY